MTEQRVRPDWVMVGYPENDGQVTILASRTLTAAELRYRVSLHLSSYLEPAYERGGFTYTAQLDNYVLVRAPTYGEALAALLGTWQPDHPDQPAAIEPRRA